jgi:hypothetical protein
LFASVFSEVDHDGALSTTPRGVVLGATSPPGTGLEVRWAADSTYKWLMVDFLQLTPAPHRGKSFQPFGAVGTAVVYTGGEMSFGFDVAGGVLVFFTDHVGASVDYRYFRGRGTIAGREPVARTISIGLDWRF